jgi:hypothetical protein
MIKPISFGLNKTENIQSSPCILRHSSWRCIGDESTPVKEDILKEPWNGTGNRTIAPMPPTFTFL